MFNAKFKAATWYLRLGTLLVQIGSTMAVAAWFKTPLLTLTSKAVVIAAFLFLLLANLVIIYMIFMEAFIELFKVMTIFSSFNAVIGALLCLAGAPLCVLDAMSYKLAPAEVPAFEVTVQVCCSLLILAGSICFFLDVCGVRNFLSPWAEEPKRADSGATAAPAAAGDRQ